MEYKVTTETDATKPVETVTTTTSQPTPVEDLTKRLAALINAGVQEYQDGQLHILFKRERQKSTLEDPIERVLREADEAFLGAEGG